MQIKIFIFPETNSKIKVLLGDTGLRMCAGDICAIWGFNEESLTKGFKQTNGEHVTSICILGKTENFISDYLQHYLIVNINSRIKRRAKETIDDFKHRKELVRLFKEFCTCTDFYKELTLDASIRGQREQELRDRRKQEVDTIKEVDALLRAAVKKRLSESDGDCHDLIIDFGVHFSFADAMLRIEDYEKKSRARRKMACQCKMTNQTTMKTEAMYGKMVMVRTMKTKKNRM